MLDGHTYVPGQRRHTPKADGLDTATHVGHSRALGSSANESAVASMPESWSPWLLGTRGRGRSRPRCRVREHRTLVSLISAAIG